MLCQQKMSPVCSFTLQMFWLSILQISMPSYIQFSFLFSILFIFHVQIYIVFAFICCGFFRSFFLSFFHVFVICLWKSVVVSFGLYFHTFFLLLLRFPVTLRSRVWMCVIFVTLQEFCVFMNNMSPWPAIRQYSLHDFNPSGSVIGITGKFQ